jgi:hypothetical protein
MTKYSKTERVGVNAVERIVINDLGWIFREQPILDFGIDAQAELVEDGPTGKLIGLQIKSGLGNFSETSDGLVYYGDLDHLDYWLSHSLPVILVAHLPESDETFWVHVTAQAIKRTKRGWRILVSKANRFGLETKGALTSVFEGTPAQQRFRKLSLDLPLMRHIKNGNKVSVELEDWINKSLGRTTVSVFVDDEQAEEHSQRWTTYFTGYDMKQLAEAFFPWAEASLDQDFYEQNEELSGGLDVELSLAADEDNNIREPGEDREESAVRPYSEAGGEVELYRLKLEVNDLGEAFLVLSDYLEEEPGSGNARSFPP